MFKKYASAILASALLISSAAAAEMPASQFFFSGWPYTIRDVCPTPQIPTCTPESGDLGGSNGPNATSAPTKEPVATTPVVTGTPIPTPGPTGTPSARPEQTAVPTVKPTATKAPSSDDDYTTDSISAQEQIAWNLLNQDRRANGLPALTLDPELTRIARIKSTDMHRNGYFAHESPTYGNVRDMLKYFGYAFTGAGENIAHHANVTKAQTAFMSSDGHRRNILSTAWTKAGIGVCYDSQGFVYVTQIFAR